MIDIKVPTKWEEVTLSQFQKIAKADKLIDVLSILTNIDQKVLKQLPVEDTIMAHLQFMNTPLKAEPNSYIVVNGEQYKINYMEKLKFLEFVDAETALKDQDYCTMLAILCRKDKEIYDDDFIANTLDDRIKMFNELPVTQAFTLLNFFLKLKVQSTIYSQKYLEDSKEEVRQLLNLIKSLVKAGDGGIFSTLQLIIKLKKLEKQLKSI